jgi:hypothetical protein
VRVSRRGAAATPPAADAPPAANPFAGRGLLAASGDGALAANPFAGGGLLSAPPPAAAAAAVGTNPQDAPKVSPRTCTCITWLVHRCSTQTHAPCRPLHPPQKTRGRQQQQQPPHRMLCPPTRRPPAISRQLQIRYAMPFDRQPDCQACWACRLRGSPVCNLQCSRPTARRLPTAACRAATAPPWRTVHAAFSVG